MVCQFLSSRIVKIVLAIFMGASAQPNLLSHIILPFRTGGSLDLWIFISFILSTSLRLVQIIATCWDKLLQKWQRRTIGA